MKDPRYNTNFWRIPQAALGAIGIVLILKDQIQYGIVLLYVALVFLHGLGRLQSHSDMKELYNRLKRRSK